LPHPLDPATADLKARAVAAARKNNVIVWVEASNYCTALAKSEPKITYAVLHTPALRTQYIQQLVAYALKDGANGIMMDWGLWGSAKGAGNGNAFKDFITEFSAACKAHGLYCGVRVNHAEDRGVGENSIDHSAMLGLVDELIPGNEDQNRELIAPFSSPEWVELGMAYEASLKKPENVVLSYRNDGIEWPNFLTRNFITQQDFKALAQKYQVTPRRDDYSQERSIEYKDEKGATHKAWISDNRTFEINCDVAKKYGLYGIGIFRLGAEDEGFWETVKKVVSTPGATASSLPAEVQPPMGPLKTIELFTDNVGNYDAYVYPLEGSKEAHHGGGHYFIVYKNGQRWWDLQTEGDTYGGGGISFPNCDLRPYLATGALQFYIRSTQGGEKFNVGFAGSKWIKDRKTENNFTTYLPISDYVKVSKKWQLVTIPLNEFKSIGETWSDRNGEAVHNEFRWHRVTIFTIDILTPSNDPEFHLQVASVRVVPTYDPKEIVKEKNALQSE
jgi:hypothetical protein